MQFIRSSAKTVNLDNFSIQELIWIVHEFSKTQALLFGRICNERQAVSAEKMADLPSPIPYPLIFAEINRRNRKITQITPSNLVKAVIAGGGDVSSADGKTVDIKIENVDVKLELYIGNPVITDEIAQGLEEALKYKVIPSSKLEILGAALVTDTVHVVNGHMHARVIPNGVISDTEANSFAAKEFFATAGMILGQGFADKSKGSISAKSRKMVERLQTTFYEGRSDPDFATTLAALVTAGQKVQIPQVVDTIGDHKKPSVSYYHKLMDATRSVRGSDQTDSTSCGSSTYLPFDVDRDMVKVYQKVTDLVNIISILGETRINLECDEIGKCMTSLLLMRDIKGLEYVGVINPQRWGWDMIDRGQVAKGDHPRYSWSNADHVYSLCNPNSAWTTVNLSALTFTNKDLASIPVQMYRLKDRYVQLGHTCEETLSTHWLPSCLVHNMTGYYFSEDLIDRVKSRWPQYEMARYLHLVGVSNVIKTFPTLSGKRMFDIMVTSGFGFLQIKKLYQLVVSKKLSKALTTVVDQDAYDVAALLEEFSVAARDRLKRAAKAAILAENASRAQAGTSTTTTYSTNTVTTTNTSTSVLSTLVPAVVNTVDFLSTDADILF